MKTVGYKKPLPIGMIAVLEGGDLDLVGIGRPVIADPLTPARLLAGEMEKAPAPESSLSVFHLLPWFNMQIERLADGLDPDLSLRGPEAVEEFVGIEQKNTVALLETRGVSVA